MVDPEDPHDSEWPGDGAGDSTITMSSPPVHSGIPLPISNIPPAGLPDDLTPVPPVEIPPSARLPFDPPPVAPPAAPAPARAPAPGPARKPTPAPIAAARPVASAPIARPAGITPVAPKPMTGRGMPRALKATAIGLAPPPPAAQTPGPGSERKPTPAATPAPARASVPPPLPAAARAAPAAAVPAPEPADLFALDLGTADAARAASMGNRQAPAAAPTATAPTPSPPAPDAQVVVGDDAIPDDFTVAVSPDKNVSSQRLGMMLANTIAPAPSALVSEQGPTVPPPSSWREPPVHAPSQQQQPWAAQPVSGPHGVAQPGPPSGSAPMSYSGPYSGGSSAVPMQASQQSPAPVQEQASDDEKMPLWLLVVGAFCLAVFLTGVALFVAKSLIR